MGRENGDHSWTGKDDAFLLENVNKMTFSEIGRHLDGLSRNAVRNRYLRLQKRLTDQCKAADSPASEPEAEVSDKPKVVYNTSGDKQYASVTCVRADTQEGALAAAIEEAQIDTKLWEINRTEVKRYEGFFRDSSYPKDPEAKKSHWVRTATVVAMWSVKLWLERKKGPSAREEGLDIIEMMKAHAPRYEPLVRLPNDEGDRFMVEMSCPDLHLGKLAWERETGTNYDSKICIQSFHGAIEHFLRCTSGLNIDEILFPIGNDFLHTDNELNETANGTRQDADSRWQKMYLKGKKILVEAIDRLRGRANVRVVIVPGNHDRTRCFYLGDTLESWYHNCAEVEIDNSPPLRKYVKYGVNLLGFSHGNEEKVNDLPALMAVEQPQLWAETIHREWHLGHLHKRKEHRFTAGDTNHGVVTRILPSLSATDAWHAKKGYVKGQRAAECYLWSRSNGYAGHLSFNQYDALLNVN
jgi:hypothetical protein